MPLKMKDSEIMQCVQVKVEIGHRATPRAKPTKEGFTHDWTVYVRSPEGSNLSHFVEKVEFHLHDTFADPLRVVTKPPYHVSEVGYADFGLPIEIYFKNKGEPQKIKFNYNLFLQTHKPVNYVRCEKLTFVNPADEFKKNLIKAGGVDVLLTGKAQFADLCGPPIKTESLKKQKQPSTISSKVLALPSGEDQFAYLFGSPIKVEKQKQPSTISSKEKVSKQLLNFSGDEKPSSSGKDISASLKSSAKQLKINNKSKGHDAASTSSSSPSSISKEKVPKTHSSREKHSCKESNNSSKMVPNPSPLPSQTRPSDSPIPIENNQTKARQSSSAPSEKLRNEDNQRYEGKAIKDQVVKHNSSENKDVSQSKSKDGKDSHKTDTSKQTSSISSKKIKKESKLKDDKVSKFDDKKEAKGDKEEDNDKKELQDDKKELTKDVEDDTNEVKDHSKVKYEKQEVKDDKKEVQNRNKEVKDDRKGVKEVKDYKKEVKEVKDDKKEDILMDNKNMKEVKDDKREVKAKQSSSSSESRKHDDKCKVEIQVYTDKEDKSSKCEHSSSKSTDAKKSKSHKRKRSDSPVSALDSSMAKKQRISMKHLSNVSPMELKEDLSFPIDISSESDDDFFGDITGSDLGVDLDISPNCGNSKTCNQIYSRSALKQLMDELEENSADDDDGITDAVDVFSPPKSSDKNSPLVESVKESSPLSCKINSYKAISEISPTIKKPTISTDSQRMSVTKSASEEKSESSQKDTQPPANTPSTVTKSKEGESSELKSTCKIDSIYEVKSQRKTVRKYINVKTKSSSSSESSKQDEKHKVEIKVNTDKEEKSSKCEHSSSKSLSKGENDKKEKSSNRHRKSEITTDAKKSKSHKRKRSSSLVSAVDSSMAKKQRISMKHLSNVSPMELKKDLSFPIDLSSESDDDFFGDITGSDLGADLDVSPSCGISKSSNQIHSRSALKQLMDELDDDSADDDDIIDTVDVFSQPKSSAKNSPLVKSVKESSALSCKINSDKSYRAISEITPTIKKPTISKDRQRKSFTKSVFEKKTESLNFNDTRNKTHNGTQPPTNTPRTDTKSKEGESSEEKSTCKIDSIFEVKSQCKTVRKYVNVKTKSSSSSESRKQDEKHKVEIKVNTDKEEKSSKCEHLSSKSLSKGENDKKEKSSNRHRKSEITTDAKKSKSHKRKRSSSPVSAVDSSMAKKQRVSMKHFSNITPMELKEDLSFPIDLSSESDDDFFGDITGNDLGADLDISPNCGISKTSNQIYSLSALKQLMDELEDNSADDDDDITDAVDVFSQPKSSAKNSPLVKPVKESSALSCKINSDKSYRAISEITPTIKKPTISKDSQRKSFTKSVFEKKTESLNFNDTRNKTHNGTQPPTKTPSPVTKSKEGESSELKSTCKIDSIFEVKSQRKTVRKYVNVKTKSSSSSENRKQDKKHKVEIKVNTDKEEKSSKGEHLSSKSLSKGENDKKEKSSNRHRISEITTDAIKEQINISGSSVSVLDDSVAEEQLNNMKDFSKVTLMELKEHLYISSVSMIQMMTILLEISGSESDIDLDISPTSNF